MWKVARLRDIETVVDYRVVLVCTESSRFDIWFSNRLKALMGVSGVSTLHLEDKSGFGMVRDVRGILPLVGRAWYVQVNGDKVGTKDFVELAMDMDTCVFYVLCSRYGSYKRLRDELRRVGVVVLDYYANRLYRDDIYYIKGLLTLGGTDLSASLLDYVVKGYSSDVDVLFLLFSEMGKGRAFGSRKDIVDLCGLGGLTVDTFIFSLLKELSGSARGLKTVMRARLKMAVGLSEAVGVDSLYNFMNAKLGSLVELKGLMIAGKVYKDLTGVPEGYDLDSLMRASRHLWRLREIGMSELLLLRDCMGTRWRSDVDVVNFLYRYYSKRACFKLEEMLSDEGKGSK